MTQHTQKTFEPFVLKALCNLTQGRALVGISHKEVEAEVMRLTGNTDVAAYGFQKGTNKPFVTRRIGWAFAGLRKQNPALGHMPKRGIWALTQAGLDESFRLLGGVPSPIEPEPQPEAEGFVYNKQAPAPAPAPVQARVEDTTPAEEPPAPVAPSGTGNLGHGVAFPSPENNTPYHHDPYIVSLAVKATNCFGCYSPRSAQCGRCPLQSACIGSIRGKLSRLAEGLRETLAAQERQAAQPAPQEAPAEPQPSEEPSPQQAKPEWEAHNRNAQSIVNQIEAVCYRCGEPIAEGESCLWAREPGAGMFHKGCK